MPVLKIYKYPAKVLRQKTVSVKKFDNELKKLVKDMFETMYNYKGIGLAANQVGVSQSVVVVDLKDKNYEPMVLINPKIKFLDKKKEVAEEGCLSFPGYYDKVSRNKKIEVEFYDVSGKKQKVVMTDLIARVVQHEVDHLNGIVFVQRMTFIRMLKFLVHKKKFE